VKILETNGFKKGNVHYINSEDGNINEMAVYSLEKEAYEHTIKDLAK
jgi:hypothetical protein